MQIAVAVARICKAVTDTQLGQFDAEGPKREYQKPVAVAGAGVGVAKAPEAETGGKSGQKGGRKAQASEKPKSVEAAEGAGKQSSRKRKSGEVNGAINGEAKVTIISIALLPIFTCSLTALCVIGWALCNEMNRFRTRGE